MRGDIHYLLQKYLKMFHHIHLPLLNEDHTI